MRRSSAVHGSTFILNHSLETVTQNDEEYNVRLSDIEEVFRVGSVIGDRRSLAPFNVLSKEKGRNEVGRAVMVLNKPPVLDPLPESPIIVYAPGVAFTNALHAHYENASAGVCPPGYYIVYFVVALVGDESSRLNSLFQPYISSLIEKDDDISYLSTYTDVEVEYETDSVERGNIYALNTPITLTAPFIQPSEQAVHEAVRIYEAATGKDKSEMFAGIKNESDEES